MLIDQDATLPGAQMFAYYFGTMLEAYTLAGLPPTNICRFIATRAVVSNVRAATHEKIETLIIHAGVGLAKGPSRNTFLLNGQTILKSKRKASAVLSLALIC